MLEESQIRRLLIEPKNKRAVAEARDHEDRLRFHGQAAITPETAGRQAGRHLSWCRGLLPTDIYETYSKLIQFPLPTIDVINDALRFFEKIFDGRNPVSSYNFTSPSALDDFKTYKKQKAFSEKFRAGGLEAIRYAANKLMVVDLPDAQASAQPEPYFYFIDIYKVRDFNELADGSLDWVAFDLGNELVAYYCDGFYRVYDISEGADKAVLVTENGHDLGYCPATWFNDKDINSQMRYVKQALPTNQLGTLDYYLFFYNCRKYLNLYVPFPIYTGLAQDCDFEVDGDEDGRGYMRCDGGYLRGYNDKYIVGNNSRPVPCPVCSKKSKAGIGAFIEYEPPSEENNHADLRNPIQMIPVDGTSLEYNWQEVERLGKDIVLKITGHKTDLVNDQAINQMQVRSVFDSGANVLKEVKRLFEKREAWLDETLAKLRYGPDRILKISHNYGTEFFTLSAEDLLESYQLNRKNGADDQVLDQILNEYYTTKYRNDGAMLMRSQLLTNLDPFRHMSKQEARGLYEAGLVSYAEFMLKARFSVYISKFERENGDIINYQPGRPLAARVDGIKNILLSYIDPLTPQPDEEEEETIDQNQNQNGR
jgi:hypothetical protein